MLDRLGYLKYKELYEKRTLSFLHQGAALGLSAIGPKEYTFSIYAEISNLTIYDILNYKKNF